MVLQTICISNIIIWFSVYAASVEKYEIIHLGESYSWKQAMEACENKSSTLPKVRIIGDGFGLVNEHIQPKNRCYWLRATYERAVNLTDNSYPSSCCEAMFMDERGTSIKECGLCGEPNHYLCASDSNNIAWSSSNNLPNAPWQEAAQYCTTHAHGLPSDTNHEFIGTLLFKRSMWVNGMRRLNLNPKQDIPMSSCSMWKSDQDSVNNLDASVTLWERNDCPIIDCAILCEKTSSCRSYFHHPSLEKCLASSSYKRRLPSDQAIQEGWNYYTRAQHCDEGYVFKQSLGLCYKLYSAEKTFNDAMITCEAEGAKLMIIRNEAELKYIQQGLQEVPSILAYKTGPTAKNRDPDLPSHNVPADQGAKDLVSAGDFFQLPKI